MELKVTHKKNISSIYSVAMSYFIRQLGMMSSASVVAERQIRRMTAEKNGEERPQKATKVTGLLISKHQGHIVRAYPGHLIFDAKSLFKEMMVLKEEVVDDDMKVNYVAAELRGI